MVKHIGLALALATALASAHCAGGGPSGTHLSVVKGNVVDAEVVLRPPHHEPTLAVRLAELFDVVGRAWAQSAVEGIRVSIEGTPFETLTDAGGNFLIEGDFAGSITLLFEREADGFVARMGIEVPEGATVTLHNVSCRGSGGLCEAEDIDVDEPSDGSESEPDDLSEGDGSGVGNSPDGNPPTPTPRNPRIRTPRNPPVPSPRNPPVPTPANSANQGGGGEANENANPSVPEPPRATSLTCGRGR